MGMHPSTRGATVRRPVARLIAAAMAGAAVLLTAGCGGDARWYGPGGVVPGKPPVVDIAVKAPTNGATDVPTAAEIAYTTDGVSSEVELTDAAGERLDGGLRPDRSSWVPAKQLKWSTKYTAKITATNAAGQSESKSVSFTTMTKPASTTRASSVIGDGHVVGVGMPIIINFGADIPKEQRAAVQRRMFVTSDPPQEGIWHWWSAREAHFRPREYWQPGTKLAVRIAIGGLPLGGNRYGATDLTVNASVGSKLVMVVDNATKQMTVTKDGQLLRTIPVSLGKPTAPSASGHFIVMIKNTWEWFDSSTYGVPADSPDGYRTKVYWTQRLTWDGEYIHAAPWSEADQGRRNVSHGCTNLSMADGEWLWHITHVGDPVIIKGTEQHVAWQNGWTDWDRPWEEYVKGSAIPYTPPAATPSASPSATN